MIKFESGIPNFGKAFHGYFAEVFTEFMSSSSESVSSLTLNILVASSFDIGLSNERGYAGWKSLSPQGFTFKA